MAGGFVPRATELAGRQRAERRLRTRWGVADLSREPQRLGRRVRLNSRGCVGEGARLNTGWWEAPPGRQQRQTHPGLHRRRRHKDAAECYAVRVQQPWPRHSALRCHHAPGTGPPLGSNDKIPPAPTVSPEPEPPSAMKGKGPEDTHLAGTTIFTALPGRLGEATAGAGGQPLWGSRAHFGGDMSS